MATVIREKIPIRKNTDGVMLVGGTRVPLDTVLDHFKEGVSAEEITRWYPTLELADVYFVIGYYLKNRVEMESYLKEREKSKKRVRKMVEARSNMKDLRRRLVARRKLQQQK